jgi:hypothetical protein
VPSKTSIFSRIVSLSQFGCASRALLKNPGFALTSILTLTLGIGITSAIFSVVYGVLLKPSPYAHPQHLCLLWKSVPKKNLDRDWTGCGSFRFSYFCEIQGQLAGARSVTTPLFS